MLIPRVFRLSWLLNREHPLFNETRNPDNVQGSGQLPTDSVSILLICKITCRLTYLLLKCELRFLTKVVPGTFLYNEGKCNIAFYAAI
jgi:hypothetical protein